MAPFKTPLFSALKSDSFFEQSTIFFLGALIGFFYNLGLLNRVVCYQINP
jgi:hypothetical protein